MKYLFILGRNEELSIAEIESYLERSGNPLQRKTNIDNGLLVEVEDPINNKAIDKLGGTISIGEVMTFGRSEAIFNRMESVMIYDGTSNKLNYTLWEFSDISDECLDYIKKRFKAEKLKGSYKGLTAEVKTQDGDVGLIPSSKLLNFEYFIFQEDDMQYFGKIVQKCNYEEIEKRDMDKPVRREELAIAPRLAKILVNLSLAKVGDTLLDPFCGIGVMLQESILQGISAVGVDKDESAIKGARQNMKWFGFSAEEYQVINDDSTKVNIPNVDCIATEPDLGDILKKVPTRKKAEDTLNDFENLMICVINNMKRHVQGRVVFTSPYIRIGKKRLTCNIERICEKTGYIEVRDAIPEFRYNQIVGRMIYVLSKA